MVEVFKTNVQEKCQTERLLEILSGYFPNHKINFDLDDCDKVLRIEGEKVLPDEVMMIVNENGFLCEVLK